MFNKINFINGAVGETPINAENLNSLQENIENMFKKEAFFTGTLNANDFVNAGIYTFDPSTTISNRPTKVANNLEFLIVLETHSTANLIQIWFNYTSKVYFRLKVWNNWTEWKAFN